MKWTKEATFRDTLGPAMDITDQGEADRYFSDLVDYSTNIWGQEREKAESIVRSNLGYFAGYYDHETRERVERLFRCAHPIFGSIAKNGAPTAEQALAAGRAMARPTDTEPPTK